MDTVEDRATLGGRSTVPAAIRANIRGSLPTSSPGHVRTRSGPGVMKAQVDTVVYLGFFCGAGDGNRTRTVSLGIGPEGYPDLRSPRSARSRVASITPEKPPTVARLWPETGPVRQAAASARWSKLSAAMIDGRGRLPRASQSAGLVRQH